MSGADSRTELWLVEILAWTCLKYKLSLSAIYVWLYEPYITQQGSHFFTLNFDFVSKQRLITEIVSCYWLLTREFDFCSCSAFLSLKLSQNSNKFSFQRKSLKKHSNVNKLYIFEIVSEFSRGKMSRNFIKNFISCFWQKSSIPNGSQTSKTTK